MKKATTFTKSVARGRTMVRVESANSKIIAARRLLYDAQDIAVKVGDAYAEGVIVSAVNALGSAFLDHTRCRNGGRAEAGR